MSVHLRIAIAIVTLCAALTGCDSQVANTAPSAASSPDEVQELMHDCMGDAGWLGILQASGIYDYSYTEEQRASFEAASEACVEEIGGNIPVERTSQEWHDLYDFYLSSYECLTQLDLDVAVPPSFEVWEETEHSWSPYASVKPDELGERFADVIAACPQTPLG